MVGILRLGEMIIPHGESILLPNDSVFFLGLKDGINEVEQEWFSNHATFHKRAVIVGAGLLGRNLAILLEKQDLPLRLLRRILSVVKPWLHKWIKPLSSMGTVRILIY